MMEINDVNLIAPDLIGMGSSDKIANYSFDVHYNYLEKFISKLRLKNITLVLHDWGSALGLHYFRNNPDNVKAIILMEAIVDDLENIFPEETQTFFKMLKSEKGHKFIVTENRFLTDVMPTWVSRPLTDREKQLYFTPFKSPEDREVIYQWVKDVPLHGRPEKTARYVHEYMEALKTSPKPKLLFYAEPGAFIPQKVRERLEQEVPNMKSEFIGRGIHFLQEDHPKLIGTTIDKWIKENYRID